MTTVSDAGLAYLFISIPHTFAKYQLSPFMAFLVYLAFILVGLHHLVSVSPGDCHTSKTSTKFVWHLKVLSKIVEILKHNSLNCNHTCKTFNDVQHNTVMWHWHLMVRNKRKVLQSVSSLEVGKTIVGVLETLYLSTDNPWCRIQILS